MTNDARTSIRLPAELLERIDNDAREQERSRAAQVVFILKKHYERQPEIRAEK